MRRAPVDPFMAKTPDPEPNLFDPEPTQSGLQRVIENTDDWWRGLAMQGIRTLAATGRPFDAYDVAELGVPEPDHANRWGGLFRVAHQQGLIRPVGYHESRRPGRSGGACRTWQGAQAA